MTDANLLPYYPRFIFNCNDGKVLETGDIKLFTFIKEKNSVNDITAFKPGQQIEISWELDVNKLEKKIYTVNRIEIHQIKYDLDKPTKGINPNGGSEVLGTMKKWLMEIYIFLDVVI